ncbi:MULTISPECIES: DUF7455 domain-containing protein [Actinomyces]|uniref:DUF7455 domain-containing protein n=2 Tax=Actinomyces TaxID=1654 RepID=A0A853EG58_9ACTO|nr:MULTISPECIES: hypothetical protein [Actinomyces]MBF0696224.1 hypothetical protein [Actinomyces bowdenii]MCR2051896.1 hypothetical protein [Actinomyces bowdenii]MDO5065070.1 hypothetical protein [Actinomyces bowdenii]NYS68397.1 hypothetical protein [Actinomyces bowdenii]
MPGMSTTSTSQARQGAETAVEQTDAPAADQAQQRPLTTADRCDVCQAQAYVRAVMLTGELFFCAHHARQHGERLREVALLFQDESSRLTSGE